MNRMIKDTSSTEIPQMLCIKTDKGCFISDCLSTSGYNYDYHRTDIVDLIFNGKKATETYCKNWYYIEEYPSLIQRKQEGDIINKRYELGNNSLASEKLPAVIPYDKKDDYDCNVIDSLYLYKYDREPSYLEEVQYDIQVICEIENYNFPPKINYTGIHKQNYSDCQYFITNANVQHQMLDKMIFPEVLLHERPCKLTSKQMYDITRQYIIEHIDNSVAKITSNYDFCFEVRKLIPLIEPETITYNNIFARTKRERNKILTTIKKYEEKSIFSMTDDKAQYKGYPVIPELCANSETELKEKVDMWLEGLMELINKPLCQCPQCKGTGYLDDISKIEFNYS